MSAPRLERVRELFVAALELPPERRRALLDDACAGDTLLRGEVEDLLALDAAPPEADAIAQGAGADWLAADLADHAPEHEPPPERIGRFQIIREIGRGGMGIVYEAQQEDPTRRVALKVIHPGTIGRGLLRRFRQETRAMAQLRHPGIAQIYEAGTSVDGEDGTPHPYFVMELVEGPTLLKYALDAGLNLNARLELVARACEALHHAHQKGVIHRDLKPDNILVHAPNPAAHAAVGPGTLSPAVQPKILDFGVSRLAEESDTRSLGTQTGQIVGTIPYLSPEQAAGESAVADIRSDVYSMGVVAFQLIADTLPFDTAGLTLRAATQVVLERPPTRLGSLVRAARGDIDTIVHKAMEREPDRRYQSAADMAADIRRYLARLPISARPPSAAYALRRFVERNRVLAVSGAAGLLLALAALIIMSALWDDARRAKELAVWQRYRSAMSAASFALTRGEIGIARRQLDAADPRFRGWEHRHLLSRLDESDAVATPALPAPFMLVPTTLAGTPSLVFIDPEAPGRIAQATDESVPLQDVDPKLRLWYAALGSRATHGLTVDGPSLYSPDPSNGLPVVHEIADWPFPPGAVLDNPRLSADGRIMLVLDRTRVPAAIGLIDFVANRARLVPLADGVFPFRAAISAGGSRIAISTGFNQTLPPLAQVFETSTGRVICQVPSLPSEPRSLLLTADGSRLIIAFHNGLIAAWDVSREPARPLGQSADKLESIDNLCLSADQSLLAGGSIDGLVRVFDASTFENTLSLTGHESEVHDVRFLPPPHAGLISAGRDGTVRRWSLAPSKPGVSVIPAHRHLVHAMAIGTAGGFLATGSWDKTVALFDLNDGRELGRMPTGTFVQALALSPDERTIATREFGGDVRLFDTATRTQIALLDGRDSTLDTPLFHADSKRVLYDFDPAARTARFYAVPTREWLTLPSDQIAGVAGPTICPEAGLIARSETRGRWFGTVLYDFRSGRELLALPARRTANEAVAFSPDGRTVVAPDLNHRIHAYDTTTGRLIGTYSGHAREVLAMAFSPDGTRLFSADYTGTIWVWDTRSREELTQLRGHDQHVRRLVVSPDGTTLISGSRDGTARIWAAPAPDGGRKAR